MNELLDTVRTLHPQRLVKVDRDCLDCHHEEDDHVTGPLPLRHQDDRDHHGCLLAEPDMRQILQPGRPQHLVDEPDRRLVDELP